MTFILYNIENKLRRSVVNEQTQNFSKVIGYNQNSQIFTIYKKKEKVAFVIKKLLFNFLIFFSKNLRTKKKKSIKNLLVFLKFYRYYNTFFFNNKILFYKKYFSKKNYNLFYLRKFFLSTKQVRLKPCLHRLKAKRISFYKKHIWNKNKKFRKKNILIFNKKFFKIYTSNRFNPFIVDSLLPFFKIKKIKTLRFLKKKLFGLLHKKYYYLFLHKRYIFSSPRKRHNRKKIISYNFRYKTYAKIFVNKKFFSYRRRKVWRQVYFIRKKKRVFTRILFSSFDSKSFNKFFFNRYKKKINYGKVIIHNYLQDYSIELAQKRTDTKEFYKLFFRKKRFFKRSKNVLYYFKWKPKTFNFHFFGFLKENKNVKKILFSGIWFKFFFRKIFWKKKKNAKAFLLFYYNNFFLNNFFLLFNSFLRTQFCFVKSKKWKKRKRLKRRRFTIYIKKIRRRIIHWKIKRKVMRFFLILLFFKFMKKHKNPEKILLLKNSFFLSNFKKIKLKLLTSILLGVESLYFKNSIQTYSNFYSLKKNLKIVSLFKTNNF